MKLCIGDHEVHYGDCLSVMAELPTDSFNMILCDLPYGTTRAKWDAVIPFEPMWEAFNRLCKGPIVLFAAQPFTSALVMSNPSGFRHEWIWEKNKATGHLNAKRRPMLAHESVLVFGNATPYQPQMTEGHKPGNAAKHKDRSERLWGSFKSTAYGGSTMRYPRSVQRFDIVNNDDPDRSHQNQKPVPLLRYLLRTYSAEGGKVLDATMGSGSTGVACLDEGRHFCGIESDVDYFETAYVRLANHKVD
jgi:DNA modification methylase